MEQNNIKKDDGFFDVFPGLQQLLDHNATIREKREWMMRQLEELDRKRQNIQPKEGLTEDERKAYIELKTFEYKLHACTAIILILAYDEFINNGPELTESNMTDSISSLSISSQLKDIFMEHGKTMFTAMKNNKPILNIVKEKAACMGVRIVNL